MEATGATDATGATERTEEPGERAGTVAAVEEYRTMLRGAELLLDGVDRALVALDEGSYGTCAECGEPIPDVVLGADPIAQRCRRHGSRGISDSLE